VLALAAAGSVGRQLPTTALELRVGGEIHQVVVGDASELRALHEVLVAGAYDVPLPRAPQVIADLGSHIGASVLAFKARYPDARIVAVEPNPEAFARLVRNVGGLLGVTCLNLAVGAVAGRRELHREPGASWAASLFPSRRDGETVTVEARRLDAILGLARFGRVDLLKLDVEGAEEDVVEELVAGGAMSVVDQLIAEYHHHLDPGRDFLGRFLERLREQGFACQVTARQPVATRVSREPTFQDVLVHAFRRRRDP
jgi:FkbM family methyltransferase